MLKHSKVVHAATIGDAWREAMQLCIAEGWDFVGKGGSYPGQIRRQLNRVMIVIDQPWTRPLSPIMPPGLPGPTNDEKIENYFANYIMGAEMAENEVYTYGTFITAQVDRVIELLDKAKGNTNQACIAIGDASTTFLGDPPCLRVVSFKVVEGHLEMSVFFRSWDLYTGFPENLGGLQLLKEYVVEQLELPVLDGPLIAYSDGLHIYEQYFEIVNSLNINKIPMEDKDEPGRL